MEDLNVNSSLINPILPVILSGGTGSRLWPLSRQCHPKQYLSLESDSKHTLLQNSFLRLLGIKGLENPLIICNNDQRFIVAEQMREINIQPRSIILEPIGRNTAPAITLAALYALNNNYDPHLLIVSSDHYIANEAKFRSKIIEGIEFSSKGRLVVYGIEPKYAETGYGYIESEEELSGRIRASSVKKFFEKPNKELANKFIRNKCFTWNSGIFLFKASSIINEIRKYQPDIYKFCINSFLENDKIFNFQRINKKLFENCPNLPIDIAVMERTTKGTVLSLDVGWSDIGNWSSAWQNSKKDSNGNFIKGKIISKDSENCYLRSEERLMVCLGMKNIIAIETIDAILISHKDSAQSVKDIVDDLKREQLEEATLNQKIYRPWGNYSSISKEKDWKVKKLEIKPLASLSLQLHKYRYEHWVVVKGTATVEIDKKVTILEKNESIFVPLGAKHRLTNNSKDLLVLIEVQIGQYLGEDDIERFEDIYDRAN